MIDFFIAVNPPTVTAQERRVKMVNGRPHFYDSERIKDAKELLTSHLIKHKPDISLSGAVRLTVTWCFPIGKTGHQSGEAKITKPDTDNLQKMLKDCMTKCGYWHDDAQVAQEIVTKIWNDPCGIYIKIENI